MSKIIVHQTVY